MTYPDRRSQEQVERDQASGKPQHLIDAYNHGWAWHTENIIEKKLQLYDLVATTPYPMWDATPEGNEFWLGFEHATYKRVSEIMETLGVTSKFSMAEFDPVQEAESFLREESDADGN